MLDKLPAVLEWRTGTPKESGLYIIASGSNLCIGVYYWCPVEEWWPDCVVAWAPLPTKTLAEAVEEAYKQGAIDMRVSMEF